MSGIKNATNHDLRPYITVCGANPKKPYKVQLRARQEGTSKLVNVHMGRFATKSEADHVAAYGDTLRRRVEVAQEVSTLKQFRTMVLGGTSIKLAFDLCMPFVAKQESLTLMQRFIRFVKRGVVGV